MRTIVEELVAPDGKRKIPGQQVSVMKPGLHISRAWSDDDVVELRVLVSDGESSFVNRCYAAHDALRDAVAALDAFKRHVDGDLLDLRFGEFGPEYANGAFHVRFHFAVPGRLFVSCEQESEFRDFGGKRVASRATMFIRSEPALLDRFVAELRAVSSDRVENAYLEGV